MFKHTISELKEALVCLQAGQVTLPYPFQPHPGEGEFRGRPVIQGNLCIGCGACANACPPRLIQISDIASKLPPGQDSAAGEYRRITFELGRCTYCGSCRDVCPTGAATMSYQFETATSNSDDLNIVLYLKLARCMSCGAVIGAQRSVNRVANTLAEKGLEGSARLDLCIQCKRKAALNNPEHMRQVFPGSEVTHERALV